MIAIANERRDRRTERRYRLLLAGQKAEKIRHYHAKRHRQLKQREQLAHTFGADRPKYQICPTRVYGVGPFRGVICIINLLSFTRPFLHFF